MKSQAMCRFWFCKALLLFLFSYSANAAFIENGQICSHVGKHHFKSCREPRDPGEIQRVIQLNAEIDERIALQRRYESCNFSFYRGWSSEIQRLTKELDTQKSTLSFINKERYWASEDIRKQNILPSETVRSAYSSLGVFNSLAGDSNNRINLLNWCLECARKSPKDSQDCR